MHVEFEAKTIGFRFGAWTVRTLNLILGTAGGFLFSLLFALQLVMVLNHLIPAKVSP